MKTNFLLCLALVLCGGLFGCSTDAQHSAKSEQPDLFPILPPITNANPSIRLPVLFHVPARLKIDRTTDELSVEIDTNSFEPTNLLVGSNMVVGFSTDIDVYPEGEPPATKSGNGSVGGEFYATRTWHIQQDGIPLPGKKYVVEVRLEIFETDIPPQHMWMPFGKNYRVLWQRTLNQTVLSGELAGSSTRQIPPAPNAEQVRAWAGFPEDFQLRAETEPVTDQNKESKSIFGKLIWAREYKNPERSLVSISMYVSQSGTLWSTNRTEVTKNIEEQIARMQALKGVDELKKAWQIVALPNGRKAYFSLIGFGPGGTGVVGFCYERDYDLMIWEDFAAENGEAEKQSTPPIIPTNDLTFIFSKVEAFLQAQKNRSSKP